MNFDLHVFNFVSVRLNLALLVLISFCIATQVHADIPETPTGLTAVATDTGINLNWTAPSDDIVGYSIYRCEEGPIRPARPSGLPGWRMKAMPRLRRLEYIDTDVTSGTTYRYAVTSNDADYDESAWSDEVTVLATATETPPPSLTLEQPTGLTVTETEHRVGQSELGCAGGRHPGVQRVPLQCAGR